MITRIINGVEYDINEYESNEIYFEIDDYNETNNGDLESILNMFYRRGGISPLSMTWELTNICNFQCPFCYINNYSGEISRYKKWNYRFDSMKSIIDRLIAKGLFICHLTGGESILHPDFKEIYRYLKSRGVLVSVFTNASLITKEHLSLFKKYKPYKVEVSIYGIEKTFSKNSKVDSDLVLRNIIKMKKNGINVIAKTPYNIWTQGQFKLIHNWCDKHDIDFYYSDELFNTYDGRDMSKYIQRLPYENQEKKIKNEIKSWGYKKNFDCSAGKYSFLLTSDRYLRPCFAFYNIPEWNFSIDKSDFFKAYNKMKYSIEKYSGKRLEFCSGCDSFKDCQECIVTQYHITDLKYYMEQKCKK